MVFFGEGDGRFGKPVTYKLPGAPHGLAVGDLNGDGSPDLVVTQDAASSVTALMNRGAVSVSGTPTKWVPTLAGLPSRI